MNEESSTSATTTAVVDDIRTPNAELAYRVLDHIDLHPDEWNQKHWITKTESGFAGCFAGLACMLSGDEPRRYRAGFSLRRDDVIDTVVKADRTTVYVPTRAWDLLRMDWALTSANADPYVEPTELWDASNTRAHLGRLVRAIFGPRPEHMPPAPDPAVSTDAPVVTGVSGENETE